MKVLFTAVWRADMIASALHATGHEGVIVEVGDETYQRNKRRREDGVIHHFREPAPELIVEKCVVQADHDVEDIVLASRAHAVDGVVSIYSPFYGGESTWPYRRDAAVRKRLIEEGIRVVAHSTHMIETAVDKAALKGFCQDRGFPTPRGGVVQSRVEALALASRIGFPVVMKPVDSAGGVGFCIADSVRSIQAYGSGREPLPRMLVEQFLTGIELSVEVLVRGSRALALTPIYKGWTGGDHPARRTKLAPAPLSPEVKQGVMRLAEAICLALEADGVCDLDLILTPEGPVLLEVNPRPSGSTRIGYWATGINIYEAFLAMLADEWEPSRVQRHDQHVLLLPVTRRLEPGEAQRLLELDGVVQVVEHSPDLEYPDSLPRIFLTAEDQGTLISRTERLAAFVPLRDSLQTLADVYRDAERLG